MIMKMSMVATKKPAATSLNTSWNNPACVARALTTKDGGMATRIVVQHIPLVFAQLLQGQTLA